MAKRTQASPDAKIIALADKLMASQEETDRLDRENEKTMVGPARNRYVKTVIYRRVDREWDIRIRLAQMQATTLEGFRAKARVVRRFSDCDDGYAKPSDSDALAWSLANDLLGLPCVWKEEEETAA